MSKESHLEKLIPKVEALSENASAASNVFAQQHGLTCLPGCGQCCQNPQIHTTVLEMLPLAKVLWQEGRAQGIMERLRVNPQDVCVMFEPDTFINGNGRCGMYQYRPGVCRLFGAAAQRDKYDKPRLVTCQRIKEHHPKACVQAQAHLDANKPAPIFADHGFDVSSLDPRLGTELIPINRAILLATQALGWNYNNGR